MNALSVHLNHMFLSLLYPQIIWVEHSEADDSSVPEMFQALVTSGHAYGAKHWLGNLVRQCERLGHIMARSDPKPGGRHIIS